MSNEPIKFGKPNYTSNESKSLVYHKLGHKEPKQRTLVARIAPPYGPLAEKGVWARYVKQHFGYTLSVTTKSGETRKIPMTFLCIEKRDRDGNITQRCPECDEIAAQKSRLESKVRELEAKKSSEEEIKSATAFIRMWLKEHNLDKKWNMAAKDQAARWGILAISHSCYKILKGNAQEPGLIDRLVASGHDPLSPEKGLWFVFTRTGTAFNEIRDFPEVFTEEISVNGETFKRNKTDALTQADIDALRALPSLDSLGRALTFDQIRMLVESGGDEETLRTVMNLPKTSPNAPATTGAASDDEPVEEVATLPTPGPNATPANAEPEADKIKRLEAELRIKQLEAEMAKLKAGQTATAVPSKPTSPAVPSGEVKKAMAMDMDAFLEKYK